MKNAIIIFVGAIIPSLACSLITRANAPATTQAVTQIEPVRLTIHPALADRASFKIRLLPEAIDQSPGDAATLYTDAEEIPPSPTVFRFPMYDAGMQAQLTQRYQHLVSAEGADYSPAEARGLVTKYSQRLLQLDIAAHRTEAHWEPSLRERGAATPLPYMSTMRHLSLLNALKIRVEIEDGHWDDARRSMQNAMAMAYHLNSEPCLVQALVAHGLIEMDLKRGPEKWMSQPGSANLYWALTAMPSPTSSLREVAQWERVDLEALDPQFRQALHGELPAEQWPALVRKVATFDAISHLSDQPADADKLMQSTLPRARAYLISHGKPEQQVRAMAAEQVVGEYFFAEYEYVAMEMWKGWELATPQALDQIDRSWREMNAAYPHFRENPLCAAHLGGRDDGSSALWGQRKVFGRTDEQLAVLRTIEAVRDYAARHEGKAPASLDQITDVPLPNDPMTNAPIAYELKEKTITLKAAKPYDRIWYELTLEK